MTIRRPTKLFLITMAFLCPLLTALIFGFLPELNKNNLDSTRLGNPH
jgi:hypothetical protein